MMVLLPLTRIGTLGACRSDLFPFWCFGAKGGEITIRLLSGICMGGCHELVFTYFDLFSL